MQFVRDLSIADSKILAQIGGKSPRILEFGGGGGGAVRNGTTNTNGNGGNGAQGAIIVTYTVASTVRSFATIIS